MLFSFPAGERERERGPEDDDRRWKRNRIEEGVNITARERDRSTYATYTDRHGADEAICFTVCLQRTRWCARTIRTFNRIWQLWCLLSCYLRVFYFSADLSKAGTADSWNNPVRKQIGVQFDVKFGLAWQRWKLAGLSAIDQRGWLGWHLLVEKWSTHSKNHIL